MRKKTCDRCRALYMPQGYTVYCLLNHKLDYSFANSKTIVPLEDCSKPLTNKEFFEAQSKKLNLKC